MIENNIPVSVLIVDDNPAKLTALAAALTGMNIVIVTAASGTETLHQLLTRDFAAVLLNVNMPVMDGFETAKIIRQRPKSEHLPIIFVTAEQLDNDSLLKGYKLGAVDYILNPVLPQILRSKVAVFADLYRLREQIERQSLSLANHNHLLEEQVAAHNVALQESKVRYRCITKGFTDYLYTVRIENGRAVETTQSPACVSVTGYTVEEFAANPYLWIQMVMPEDRDRVMEHVRQVLVGADVTPFEHRILRKDGEIRWVSDTTILFKDTSGELLSYDGVIKDITERKHAEAALRESETRLQTIIENLTEGLAVSDLDGQLLHFNHAALDMHGYATLDECRQHLSKFADTFELSAMDGAVLALDQWPLARVLRGENLRNLELRIRHIQAGWQRVFNYGGTLVRDAGGQPLMAIVLISDITERKQSEVEIRQLNTELEQRVAERTTELELALSTMRTSEERYRLLIDGVKDVANIMLDTSGRVISWNQGAERLKGYTKEEIIGRHFSIFYPPDVVATGKLDAELAQALKQGRAEDEGWRVRKDGSRFWANVIITSLFSDKGELQGFSKITRDITERKQAEQNLLIAKEAAELANRAKDSFLATMSHEIRTPLTGMLGMLEILSLTPLNRDQGGTLKAVWDSSRSLLRIVNDILDWSRIVEGKLALAPQSTSIPQLLQEVVNTYSRVASAKSLVLWQHADARLSQAHIVDALRLSQILNNFVSNAIKFTQRGEIELRAELLEQLDSGERIRFSVKDTGIGIAKDVQQHLFQRYRQASADTARRYGGTGLGLSICQRLADLMDGQIELVSEPEQGSIFSFTLILPVSAAPGEHIPALFPDVEQKKVKPLLDGSVDTPLVLAVDDHPINRDLLARQIKLLGLRAETAENGKIALSMWGERRFALVITDCHMPEMNGYALTRAIRKIEAEKRIPRTPIIAWTANALAEEAEHCQAAGMDELLVKPADLAKLKKMLAKWLSIAETDSSQPAPSTHDAGSGHGAEPIDYAVLEQVVPDSKEHIQVLHNFQAHIRADRAKLLEALEQGDQVNAELTAHRMKGSCQMVGATDIASVCAAIEQTAHDGNMDGAWAARTGLDDVIKRLETYLAEVKKSEEKNDGSECT